MELMKNPNKKKYIAIAIILIFAITNPSRGALASYLREKHINTIGRDFNGLIFSLYGHTYDEYLPGLSVQHQDHYIGILGNFIKIPFWI
ncbi:hypothetical protein, partial [Pedobacter sp.]|jgi:hypothetical protein|uniref:hypothetical protein n=1 Tax=Pedobacter sp. TaxID=1411316 RepID=UPI002CFD6DE9